MKHPKLNHYCVAVALPLLFVANSHDATRGLA
jgi:hypothetical protein